MPFDGTELSPTTRALIRGRQRIEAGWCQGVMRTREGVCAVGAVSFHADALRMLQRALGRDGVSGWNDVPIRTKDEVLCLYDRAIALSLNPQAYPRMLALSIKQPWAWLIVSGHKDIENRTWPTRYRGWFFIHAGKQYDGPRGDWDWPEIERPQDFEMGGIIGEAELVDCVTDSCSPWFCGPYGFVIRRARTVPFWPMRGALGFFSASSEQR